MNAMGNSCERAMALELRRAEGLVLGQDDERRLAQHRSSCPQCSMESEVLALLESQDSASPADLLDDIARRRFIDEVLQKAEGNRSIGLGSDAPSGGQRVFQLVRFAGIAAAAAAALVLFALQFFPGSQGGAVSGTASFAGGGRALSLAPLLDRSAPRLLLSSGDVRVEGRPAMVGSSLRGGQRIETQGGSAVIAIGDGIFVELSSSTRASLEISMSAAIEVVLDAGKLLISVDSSRAGPMLSVVTPHGRATVTGTVFSVEVADDDSIVSVARGKVEVDSMDTVAAVLPAGLSRNMVSGGGKKLRAEELQAMSRRDELFALLDTQGQGVVDISSVPLGAKVTVDGSPVGSTPVVVALRPGHRDLSLRVEGEPVVRELMDIEVGTRLERVFDLTHGDTTTNAKSSEPPASPGASVAPSSRRKSENVRLTAEQLLFEAQSLRGAQQFQAAARVYRRIVEEYPSNEIATSALVSLGTIELEKLRQPASALGRFNLYLSRTGRSGALTPEALHGKARALRDLNSFNEEREVLKTLVGSFGRSLYSQAAKTRLKQLETESR